MMIRRNSLAPDKHSTRLPSCAKLNGQTDGTVVNNSATLPRLWLGALAIAATALLSGCAHESAYPNVYDSPPPRADKPMTADEAQKATDDLVAKRDRLSTPANSSGKP